MRISLAFFAICIALPKPGICGGNDWPFYVSVAPAANGCMVIQLKPAETGKGFPLSCKQLTLSACYNWPWWQLDKPVSRSEHERAIGFLFHAQSESAAVRFGAMGEGFGNVVKGEACQATSTALQIIDSNAVYSYFKWQ